MKKLCSDMREWKSGAGKDINQPTSVALNSACICARQNVKSFSGAWMGSFLGKDGFCSLDSTFER